MSKTLSCLARDLFADTLKAIDVQRVVQTALRLEGKRLLVDDESFDLDRFARVTVIAMGKAAEGMARATQGAFGDRLTYGLVVTHCEVQGLGACWESFSAGHPVPDAGSVRAAKRALELVAAANSADDLVVFLISGGASAMLECPLDPSVSLVDLQAAHSTLVTCGAVIGEMNIVRRRLSGVKGGRLAAAAPKATQLSLLISDVNAGDLATIASGPTLPDPSSREDFETVLSRYDLRQSLAPSVLAMIDAPSGALEVPPKSSAHLLMSDRQAVEAAVGLAAQSFDVVDSDCWEELPVTELAQRIVARLQALVAANPGRSVCFVSAGESICPVRGSGRGGRNQELALRMAPLLREMGDVAFLAAGTDGIDGNSPAAGALVDAETLVRAEAKGLSAARSLEQSDSFTLFDALGATVVTGPTGNNVRDLWIAMARS